MRETPFHRLGAALILAVLALLTLSRVSFGESAMGSGCPESGVRIYLDRHGTVTVNGGAVALEKLASVLAAIQPRPTVVCYSREDAQQEPPAQYQAVIEAIMALRLPVGLFTDNTFKTPVSMK